MCPIQVLSGITSQQIGAGQKDGRPGSVVGPLTVIRDLTRMKVIFEMCANNSKLRTRKFNNYRTYHVYRLIVCIGRHILLSQAETT